MLQVMGIQDVNISRRQVTLLHFHLGHFVGQEISDWIYRRLNGDESDEDPARPPFKRE